MILFILLRIDYYLMMLSCLGTLYRVMRDLEEEVEALMTNKDVQQKTGGPVQHDFESASASRTSMP